MLSGARGSDRKLRCMGVASVLLCALITMSCNPFAQPAPRITREPEPAFGPLASSDALRLAQRSAAATYAVAYADMGPPVE